MKASDGKSTFKKHIDAFDAAADVALLPSNAFAAGEDIVQFGVKLYELGIIHAYAGTPGIRQQRSAKKIINFFMVLSPSVL